jgi:outer membrane protein assembly factor BamB
MKSCTYMLTVALMAPCAFADLGDQIAKLLPADGAPGDFFGRAVAISATTALVGAKHDDPIGASYGSAYLFDGITGAQLATLVPLGGSEQNWFGWCVAIDGNAAVVGSPFDADYINSAGAAYIFDSVTGAQVAKIVADDIGPEDLFGYSVGISAGILVVGAPANAAIGPYSGSAYLFDATTGRQLDKLLPDDGAAEHRFGECVAVSATTAIVGANGHAVNGTNSGAAYLFDTTTGKQIALLQPEDPAANAAFGSRVGIDGAIAIVGAPGDEDFRGAAYLFNAKTGEQITKLMLADGAAGDNFGQSVAVSGNIAIVGTPGDNTNSGSAYFFDATTGEQISSLAPNDGAAGDGFGFAVAIWGTTAIVGAKGDDDNGFDSGSAYLFDASIGCPADMNADGALNILDFVAFQNAFVAMNREADCDANGAFNILDFVCFQQLFQQGCP